MLTPAAFEDRRTAEGRLLGLRVAVIASFSALALAFWLLQVVQHARYEELAANNHLKTIPLRAPRGVVFDRDGQVLVENRTSFTIAIVPERTADLEATIRRLAEVTGVDDERLRTAVARRQGQQPFRPLPVIEHATFAQVAAVAARRRELPEVDVQEVPTRSYPTGVGAHLFGYVGEIREAQLTSGEYADEDLQPGAIVGQTGIEKVYNARLMGTDGNRFVRVNSVGREIDDLRTEYPEDGQRLQLTLDVDLQRALEDSFEASGYAGAGAFLDPRTGEVLAMTSLPAYDPNAFAVGIDNPTWTRLMADPQRPLTNRLIQGTYSPGSTFKIVMAIAALEEGIITPETRFYCPGYGTFYGRVFRCHRASGHGSVDLRQALEQSCNVYFYNVGSRLKIDTIHEYADRLGLTSRTGIDLPGEGESLVPSTAWKQRAFGQPWYPGETISVAIGQGAVSVTPIALATMIATVANGGTLVTPHLLRAVGDGRAWTTMPPPAPRSQLFIDPAHLQAVRDGLWMVVNAAGTGGRARIAGRDVAGKTGTAQVVGLQNRSAASAKIDVRDHGWFVFFAPRDNPQIAGVVLAEHGEHGSTAASIARHVLATFFAKRDGAPLPTLAPTPAPVPAPPVVPAAAAPPAGLTVRAESVARPAGDGAPDAP